MKKNTSKLLSLTLSLALCLSLVPTVAFAAEQPTEGPVEVTEMGPSVDTTNVVAKIGDTTYTSIQEAIDAANGETTIVVQKDVTYSEAAPLKITNGKTIILDLNDHTVSQEFKEGKNSALLTNMGTLTIQDSGRKGKLTANATNPDGKPFKYGNYTIDNHGQLTVKSGTVENTTKVVSGAAGAATYAVNSISDKGAVSVALEGGVLVHSGNGNSIRQMARSAEHENNLTVNDGAALKGGIFQQLAPSGDAAAKANLTMKGGELSGSYAINQNSTNGKFDNAHITVTGGTVHGAISINWPFSGDPKVNAGHVSITGGSFDKVGFDIRSIFDIYSKITGDMKFITGGTYVEDPSAYVPTGYEAVKDDQANTWTVQKIEGKLDANTNTENGKTEADISGEFKPDGEVSGNTGSGSAVSKDNATFDLTSKDSAKATKVTATVKIATAKSIGDASASMTLKTDVAEVTLDAAAMKAVGAATSDITVEINKASITADGVKAAVEVNVEAGNQNLLPSGQAKGGVTITIPVTVDEGKTPFVYYVTGTDEKPVYMEKLQATFAADKVTFTTNHLSKYAVTDTEQTTPEASYTTADSGEKYGDLKAALEGVKDGGTVTLRKDIVVNKNDGYTLSKNFTLDLNGHTITQKVPEKKASVLFTNKGNLTIKDSSGYKGGLVAQIGKNADSNWGYGNYVIDNQGTLILDCNISNTLEKPYGAAIALNNVPGSSMTIKGGKIETVSTAIRLYAKDNTKSVALTIEDGTIISPDPIWIQVDGTSKPKADLTITGGKVISNKPNDPCTIRTTNANKDLGSVNITISGGEITGGKIQLGETFYGHKLSNTKENVKISGGKIDCIEIMNGAKPNPADKPDNGYSAPDRKGQVTGGIFKDAPKEMIEDSAAAATVAGSNGTVTAVGEKSIKEAAKQPGVTKITVTQGDVTLGKNEVPEGAVVENAGNGKVQVGDQTIDKGNSLVPNPIKPSGGGSSSTSSHEIVIHNDSHGTISVMPSRASKGERVTITVNPDNGYVVDKVIVTDHRGDTISVTDKGNGKFTFTMPSGKVSVKATFRAQQQGWVNPFYDVDSNAYYYDAVAWAAQKGITGGTSAVTFSPDAKCTRAQIVTFLWNAAGSPAPHGSQKAFKDVPANSYYATAVLWAVENGITSGTSDTTFSPDLVCTRAQAVTFLHRSQKAPAVGSGTAFGDVAADAYYASAVSWAAQNGITGGTGANTFSPDASCTRAQIVTFLYRTFVK